MSEARLAEIVVSVVLGEDDDPDGLLEFVGGSVCGYFSVDCEHVDGSCPRTFAMSVTVTEIEVE